MTALYAGWTLGWTVAAVVFAAFAVATRRTSWPFGWAPSIACGVLAGVAAIAWVETAA